jgi:hypothetical protein
MAIAQDVIALVERGQDDARDVLGAVRGHEHRLGERVPDVALSSASRSFRPSGVPPGSRVDTACRRGRRATRRGA